MSLIPHNKTLGKNHHGRSQDPYVWKRELKAFIIYREQASQVLNGPLLGAIFSCSRGFLSLSDLRCCDIKIIIQTLDWYITIVERVGRAHTLSPDIIHTIRNIPLFTNCLRAHSISREAQLVYHERDVHSKASLLLKFVQNKEWRVNMDLRYFYKRYSGGGCCSETHSASVALHNENMYFWGWQALPAKQWCRPF